MTMTREELEQKLRELIVGCPGGHQDTCPFCHCGCDDAVATAMELVDQYAVGLPSTSELPPGVEVWSAAEAAEFLGYDQKEAAAAARSTLSRWGIRRIHQEQAARNGRPMVALYPAAEIRAEAVKRGRRT